MKEEGEKAWSLLNQLLHDDRIDVDLSSTEYLISAFIRIKRLRLLIVPAGMSDKKNRSCVVVDKRL